MTEVLGGDWGGGGEEALNNESGRKPLADKSEKKTIK